MFATPAVAFGSIVVSSRSSSHEPKLRRGVTRMKTRPRAATARDVTEGRAGSTSSTEGGQWSRRRVSTRRRAAARSSPDTVCRASATNLDRRERSRCHRWHGCRMNDYARWALDFRVFRRSHRRVAAKELVIFLTAKVPFQDERGQGAHRELGVGVPDCRGLHAALRGWRLRAPHGAHVGGRNDGRGDVKVRLEHFQEGLVNQRNFYCATAPDPRTLWNVGYPVELDPSTAGPPGSRGGQLAALEGLGRRTIRWPRYQRRWPKKRREG